MEHLELDKFSIKILTHIKKSAPIGVQGITALTKRDRKIIDIMRDLLEKGYIERTFLADSHQDPDIDPFYIDPKADLFKISLAGERVLEQRVTSRMRFVISSILVPIFVALITSIATNIVLF